MNTIRKITETGKEYNETIKKYGRPTTIEELFEKMTNNLLYRKENFKMRTLISGELKDDNGNVIMELYKASPNHEYPSTQIVIKTYTDEAEKEIESLDWLFLNFDCKVS
jgi:hypothetical protein